MKIKIIMIDEVRINWDYVVIRYIYVDYIKGILKILGIFVFWLVD